jgi:hypothetical protein
LAPLYDRRPCACFNLTVMLCSITGTNLPIPEGNKRLDFPAPAHGVDPGARVTTGAVKSDLSIRPRRQIIVLLAAILINRAYGIDES